MTIAIVCGVGATVLLGYLMLYILVWGDKGDGGGSDPE